MPNLTVDGARIHYLDEGFGDVIVLLHGIGASSEDWEAQVDALRAQYRVIAPDLRGFGKSERAGNYRIERFAADVWALLAELKIDRFSLVGHSMGGAIALEMAIAKPACIERILLANTLPSFQIDTWKKRLLFVTRLGLMAVFGPGVLARRVADRLFPGPEHEALRRQQVERGAGNSRWVYLQTISGLIGWTAASRLSKLVMPALVLMSEHDYFPIEDGERFAGALPNSRFVLAEGMHHSLQQEAPALFNDIVLSFMHQPLAANLEFRRNA